MDSLSSNIGGRARKRGLRTESELEFYFDRFWFAGLGCRVVAAVGFLSAASVLVLGFLVVFDSSLRTAVLILAASILYRAAARARFESFARDCLGL